MNEPRIEYNGRLRDRRSVLNVLRRRDTLYANGRLVIFLAGLGLAWGVLGGPGWPPGVLAIPLGLFIAFVVLHEWAIRRARDAEQSIRYYEDGLRRLDDTWAGHGNPGDGFRRPDHLYAEDLDLFGPGSLFELLCVARTQAGERALARRLCTPAEKHEAVRRQAAVQELGPALDLRERLWLAGGDARPRLRPELLAEWSAAPGLLPGGAAWWIAIAIGAGVVGATIAWAAEVVPARAILFPVLVALVYQAWIKRRANDVLRAGDEPLKDLRVLSRVARRIEEAAFHAEELVTLQATLCSGGRAASSAIAALARLNAWQEAQRNAMFAPFALVLLWNVHFAYAIEWWRVRHGAHVRAWLEAIGEFEAVASLATYAFERPDDVYPEISEGAALFDGEAIGHPLIPAASCVRNDVALGTTCRLLIVSGSNMSGKSTLLRTVGVNSVLAYSGAPARARRLRLAPMQIGASIHVIDSIQTGTSHFYAEILRLRAVLDCARGPLPVLFLIDEILHGTNSHDRRAGSEAVLRRLVESGAIGLVTTHDLALTAIAEGLGDRALNVHFVDQLEAGRLVFDYKMRPGVVERSNALALMRHIGLEV